MNDEKFFNVVSRVGLVAAVSSMILLGFMILLCLSLLIVKCYQDTFPPAQTFSGDVPHARRK
jgi:hypothetical protein